MPEDDVASLGRAIVIYKNIRQKCRFDLKSEGKKKLGSRGESVSVQGTVWKWGKKKPLRRGGWVVHNKDKGVSPERSGGHQFCHFFSVR